MNWTNIWINLFGRTEFMGLNIGFWVAMFIVIIIVIIMNVVFWSMKPYDKNQNDENKKN